MNRISPRFVLLALPLALLLATSVPAAAQEPWRIKALGGVNSADADVTANLRGLSVETTAKSSYSVGLGLDARCSETFITRVEVLYTVRETDMTYSGGGLPPFDATYEATQLDMPVTVKAQFGKGVFRPFLAAGLVFSYLLSAEETGTQQGFTQTFDIEDQLNGAGLAATAGLGFDLRVGDQIWLSLEGRYNYGLTNWAGSGDEMKTRDLQGLASVGYDF